MAAAVTARPEGDLVEFLVDFDITVPEGVTDSEVHEREAAEAAAASRLVADGHLRRVWRRSATDGKKIVVGLYSAASDSELDEVLRSLPLYDWMRITVTPFEWHPNDPAATSSETSVAHSTPSTLELPEPRLTLVYRLEASVGQPIDLGKIARGTRRIVPLIGGTFTGPTINGSLVPGASADWQVVQPDGTALGDIRYTLRTDRGDVLYVRSRSVRSGTQSVLSRLGRGEFVDPSEYTFRASTEIEAAGAELDWMNKGVFTTVGARTADGVIYETYLVG